MSVFTQRINATLTQRREQGLLRRRVVRQESCLNFCSNDYLSLSSDERVKQAYQHGYAHYPSGSGASSVVSGYHAIHQQLEQTFVDYLAVEDAMLFSSGYAANVSVLALLAGLDIFLVIDKAAHASCYDGIKSVKLAYERYLPNDMDDLTCVLKRSPADAIVMTEGIFSMSGQQAQLDCIMQATSHCIIDEAHSFGVMGAHGLGAAVHFSLTAQQIPLRVITFGKAMAGQGAIVVGQRDWIAALLQYARPQLYSTALSPALAYGLLQTLHVLYEAEDRRQHLQRLITYFRNKIKHSSLRFADSITPIQQLQLGCPHRALSIAEYLQQGGIFCQAMRQPTVSREQTGLRIVLNYCHSFPDIDALFNLLSSYDNKYSD